MNVSIKYLLSTEGQKHSILTGGDGKHGQVLSVAPSDPSFSQVVKEGSVDNDGNLVLDLTRPLIHPASYSVQRKLQFDAVPQSVSEVMAALHKAKADLESEYQEQKRKEEERNAERSKRDQEAIAAWAAKPVADRIYSGGTSSSCYVSEPTVSDRIAFMTHPVYLETKAECDRLNREIQERKDSEEKAREAARLALRAARGLEDSDVALKMEEGCLAQVPKGLWESHSRGKNWFAVISISPTSPGGLARTFANKANGELYYLLPDLKPGDAIEFGADYYSGSGKKSTNRWYGFFVRQGQDADGTVYVVFRKCSTGKDACKQGKLIGGN